MKESRKSKKISVTAEGRLQHAGATFHTQQVLWFLLLVPALIMALKVLPWTKSSVIAEAFSLTSLPGSIALHVQRLTLMSVGALIVVIFRLTLGIRVLGPVRPILIALAYQITGFMVGTVFLVSVMIIIALIRPVLRAAGMPYFARIAMVLSLVCMMVLITLKIAVSFGAEQLLSVGLLPVVVLTFAAEGFAKTLYKEGIRSASWRASMTIFVAVLIAMLVEIPGSADFILRFPEMLLLQIGLIYLIAQFFSFRALEFLNPKPVSVKKTNRKKKPTNKTKTKMKSKPAPVSTPTKGGFLE